MVSCRLVGFGETKEYSLQPTLKKSVNKFNGNVNEKLNPRFSLHYPKSFRTFAVPKWNKRSNDGKVDMRDLKSLGQ